MKRFKIGEQVFTIKVIARFCQCKLCYDKGKDNPTGKVTIKGKDFQCPECHGTLRVEHGLRARPEKATVAGWTRERIGVKEKQYIKVRYPGGTSVYEVDDQFVFRGHTPLDKAIRKIEKQQIEPQEGIVGWRRR